MANTEAAETQSPNISEIAAELSTVQAKRFLLWKVEDEPYSVQEVAQLFGMPTTSAYNPLSLFCGLGLLILEKEERKTGDITGIRSFYTLSETGVKVQELLRKREDLSPQLSPELSDEKLTPAEQDFFLELDPTLGARSINEIAKTLEMGKEYVRNLLKALLNKKLMDPPRKSQGARGDPQELFHKLSESGVLLQAFLKDQPEANELSSEERTENWVKEKHRWFPRLVIATVWEVYLEREKKMKKNEKVGEKALCLVKHVTQLLVDKDQGYYANLHDRVRSNMQAAAGAGILIVRNWDRAEDGNTPLHGEPNRWKHLKKLLVVGIRQNMLGLIQRVCDGEYGGFSEPAEENSGTNESHPSRIEEILSSASSRDAAMRLRLDEGHETGALSEMALKIYAFLKKKNVPFPRKPLVRDFGEGALEGIVELVQAGCVEVSATGIVKIIGKLPRKVAARTRNSVETE